MFQKFWSSGLLQHPQPESDIRRIGPVKSSLSPAPKRRAASYQGALIMTHRDGFPRLSARSAWRGDAGHRKPCAPSKSIGPSESLGKPPFRSDRRTGSGRIGGRRKALTTRPPQQRRCRRGGWMSRIARGFPATRPLARRIACPISMGHYQGPLGIKRRALVLRARGYMTRRRCGAPMRRRHLTAPMVLRL